MRFLYPALFIYLTVSAQDAAPRVGVPQPVIPVTLSFSEQPEDVEITGSHLFPEMLSPLSGPEQEGENADIAAALLAFAERTDHEDISMFTAFMQQHPTSRWNASIMLNLAFERYERGYLSQALQYWENAWNLANTETNETKLVADRAAGEILLLNARLGRVQVLEQYLALLKTRDFDGSIGSQVDSARQGLARMKTQPEIAFKCGPYALNSILNSQAGTPNAACAELEAVHSTSQGTNLLQVRGWAAQVGLNYQVAKRGVGAVYVHPAVMHWKLDHFAALLGQQDGRYLVQDATFGGAEMWITEKALEAETDDYFLIPAGPLPEGWTAVPDEEAAQVWGKGGASGRADEAKNTCSVPTGNPTCPIGSGMAWANYYLMHATLNIKDTPMYHVPPVGPAVDVSVNYNHLEFDNATLPTYANLGAHWDFNWIGFVDVDASLTAKVRLRNGGTEIYPLSQFNNITGTYAPNRYSQAVLRWTTDAQGNDVYRREFRDGSAEIYSQPLSSIITTDRRYFLKQIVDAQGNALTLNYEFTTTTTANPVYANPPIIPGQNTGSASAIHPTGRVIEIVDASGGVTLIRYLSNTRTHKGFLKVHRIYSPAPVVPGSNLPPYVEFGYDGTATLPGRLNSIRDVVGMVSKFTYDPSAIAADFIDTMTTEYGRTLFHQYSTDQMHTFADGPDNNNDGLPDPEMVTGMMRGLRITYPNGSVSVVENWLGHDMKTFHWNRTAMKHHPLDVLLPITDPAREEHCEVYKWLMEVKSRQLTPVIESIKRPLKSEVKFGYDGQTDVMQGNEKHSNAGDSNQPSAVSVTEQGENGPGVMQQSSDYNLLGNLTEMTDPLGRTTRLAYAGNGVDLLEVRQKRPGGTDLLSKMQYNSRHLPTRIWDAGGHLTELTYNQYGQVTTAKDALGRIVTYNYAEAAGAVNPNAHDSLLESIDGPLPGAQDSTQFTYDDHHRLESVTDPEGYTVRHEYDELNRVTKVTYQPQGVPLAQAEYEEVVWDRLNPVLIRDRKGRLTRREYDEMGQLVAETDPEGRRVVYEWCICGSLSKLVDGNGRVTEWFYDEAGRLTDKKRADGRLESITYYPDSDRVRYVTLARLVRREFIYRTDGTVKEVKFQVNTGTEEAPVFVDDPLTPKVTYVYDPVYPRPLSASSTEGTISYDYHPYRSSATAALLPGAGQLRRVVDAALSGETFYFYDALGRVSRRSIDAVVNDVEDALAQVNESEFDEVGRVKAITDPLGRFVYQYVDAFKGLSRLDQISYPNGQVSRFGWQSAAGHHRLESIVHTHTPLGGGAVTAVSAHHYGYGAQGRLTSWQQQVGAATPQIWDIDHDDAEQLRSVVVRDGQGAGTILKQYHYGYDAAGNRSWTQEDLRVRQVTHNNLNQITARPAGGPVRFQGMLNEPGTLNITAGGQVRAAEMRTALNPAGQPEFEFRADVPLVDGVNQVELEARDGNGLLTERTVAVTVSGQAGAGIPLYDTRGNMTSNGRGHAYAWDALNRLIKITYADGSRSEFSYDALGRRVREVEWAAVGTVYAEKHLLWCGLELCQERDAQNVVMKMWCANGWVNTAYPVWQKYFVTRDHLGSVREVTNAQGRVLSQHRYGPYGEQEPAAPPGGGLREWLRADVGVVKDSNNRVTQWQTSTGSPAAIPPTTSARPLWVNAALNGKPIIRFDGVDDTLSGGSGLGLVSGDFTVFVVHRRESASADAVVVSFSTDLPRGSLNPAVESTLSLSWRNLWTSPNQNFSAGLGIVEQKSGSSSWHGTPRVETAPAALGDWQISTMVKADTEWVDPFEEGGYGTAFRSDLTVRTQSGSLVREHSKANYVQTYYYDNNVYTLGRRTVNSTRTAQGFLSGDIAEVLIYDRALSAAEQQQVEAYLKERHTPASDESSDFRYTGHYYHRKSGLHLAPYRAYDAEMAVWLSEDPIQESGGINLYGYVGGSPLVGVDPLGLQECLDPAGMYGGLAATMRGQFSDLKRQLEAKGHAVNQVTASSTGLAQAVSSSDATFFFGHGNDFANPDVKPPGDGFDKTRYLGLTDGTAKTSLLEDLAKKSGHSFRASACYHNPFPKSKAAGPGGFRDMMSAMRKLLDSPTKLKISYGFGPQFPNNTPINQLNPMP